MTPEAQELKLYIENDGRIYERSIKPIYKSLATKKARGEYEHEKAIKAFMYVVNEGAKRYVREHGSMTDKWSRMFDSEARQQVAEGMVHYFEAEWRLGQFRDLLPKKYQIASKATAAKLRVARGRVLDDPGSESLESYEEALEEAVSRGEE